MQLKLLTVLISAGLAASAAHAAVTDKMIENEATATGNVLTWGLNTQGQRYSPLKQVNTATVGKLAPVWAFSFGGEKQRGQEVAAGDPQRQDVRHRVVLAPVRARRDHRPEAVEVRAPPARRHHALLRRGQPRRRAVRQPGDLRHARRAARRARPGHRRRGLEGEDRRLQGRLLGHRGADHRQRPGAHRRVGRRVRRGRPRRGARRRRPASWSGRARPSKATWATPTTPTATRRRTASPARPTRPGRATCGRPAARPPGSAAPTTPRPAWPTSAPATRRRGTATCARATTCSRARPSPST